MIGIGRGISSNYAAFIGVLNYHLYRMYIQRQRKRDTGLSGMVHPCVQHPRSQSSSHS